MPSNHPFMIFWCNHGMTRNGRKSCSYVRSKSWTSLIYHLISPRGISGHSLHGSRGRLKLWFIAFNFDSFRTPSDPVIFLSENILMRCAKIYNAFRVLRSIWIALECHRTTHLWFCGAAIECPRNGRKSCSYIRSKSWKSLIYHPIFPRGISRHPV